MSSNEDSNFSRAFKHFDDEINDSAIHDTVCECVDLILENKEFPKNECTTKKLEFVHRYLDGISLNIPTRRKDQMKAQKEFEIAKQTGSMENANIALRFANSDSLLAKDILIWRAAKLQSREDFRLATLDLTEVIEAIEPSNSNNFEQLFRLNHKLAQCHSKSGNPSGAVKALQDALNHLNNSDINGVNKQNFKTLLSKSMDKLKNKKDKSGKQKSDDVTNVEVNDPLTDNPKISSQIQIENSALQGRFAVAKEQIPCGTVLVVDTPVAYILNPDDVKDLDTHCVRCFVRTKTVFPCSSCSAIIYCSPSCRFLDRDIHRYECACNMYQFRREDVQNSCRIFLALRILFKNKLSTAVECSSNENDLNLESDIKGLFQMVSHQGERSEYADVKYQVLSHILLEILYQTEYPRENQSDIETLTVLCNLLQILDVNTHPVMSLDTTSAIKSEVGLGRIGSAVNVNIGSYFNHSCNPNTCRINQGTKTILVATRTIEAGEEVADIYSMHYSEIPRSQRQTWLMENFFFRCRCQACVENWLPYDALPSSIDEQVLVDLQKIEKEIQESLRSNDVGKVVDLHKKDVNLIEKKVQEPHKLYVSLRNSFQFCLWRKFGMSKQ